VEGMEPRPCEMLLKLGGTHTPPCRLRPPSPPNLGKELRGDAGRMGTGTGCVKACGGHINPADSLSQLQDLHRLWAGEKGGGTGVALEPHPCPGAGITVLAPVSRAENRSWKHLVTLLLLSKEEWGTRIIPANPVSRLRARGGGSEGCGDAGSRQPPRRGGVFLGCWDARLNPDHADGLSGRGLGIDPGGGADPRVPLLQGIIQAHTGMTPGAVGVTGTPRGAAAFGCRAPTLRRQRLQKHIPGFPASFLRPSRAVTTGSSLTPRCEPRPKRLCPSPCDRDVKGSLAKPPPATFHAVARGSLTQGP